MRIILLSLLIMVLPFDRSHAASTGLYTGEVVVASQQAADRRRALPPALMQVLQKLSGLREFDDYPLVGEYLDNAGSLLVSFHYRIQQKSQADGSTSEELRLVARFSEPDVNELMRVVQLPLWQPDRLVTEVWVVVDDGRDRRIFPVEYAYAWDTMDEAASDRGLPLSWPQEDEDGQYPIDEQLLWGGYTEDLVGLGRHAVMVAAARREGPEWSVRFNLAHGDQSWTWRNRDVDLQLLLSESVQEAVDLVAAANTISASDQGKWLHELTVTGIRGADEYRRCLAYLEELSIVEKVAVQSARSGLVRYRLELNALPGYLEDSLAAGRMLQLDEKEGTYLLRP